jgi:hypothetical protein
LDIGGSEVIGMNPVAMATNASPNLAKTTSTQETVVDAAVPGIRARVAISWKILLYSNNTARKEQCAMIEMKSDPKPDRAKSTISNPC